ncbi:MAG: hypothetical protein ACYC6Y_07750 [Thermoguttaceae bacterium]
MTTDPPLPAAADSPAPPVQPSGRLGRLLGRLRGPLGRLLASPWMALVAVAVALLLTAGAVHNGLDGDDYYHRAVMEGSPRFRDQLRGPQSMFRFLPGNVELARRSIDEGFLPWWTDPRIKAEFLQFLTVQTHILDYWLWPERPELMHLHSLAWFALLVFLAARFYRRLLGPTWMAGMAALLLAVEDGHGTPVGWICNRNVMLAATFGFGCLIAHDAWRREGKRWAFWAALVLWTCSLCSKEEGIATCAYLFAYALWLDRASLWTRFLTLVPYGLVLVAWRIVRDGLGYGVAHLGVYIDPITDPSRYALALVERFPVFVLGQWGAPSDLAVVVHRLLGSPLWWIAVAYAAVLGLIFWPVLRRDPVARFFATGMLLAMVPVCATFPTDRLLMFAGLGAFGLLVRFWHAVFAPGGARPPGWAWRVLAVPLALLLGIIHLVLAPLMLTFRATAPTGPKWFTERLYIRIPFDPSIRQQDLVVVNPPSVMHANYSLFLWEHDRLPSPRGVRALAPGFRRVTVRRLDDRTLELEPREGFFRFFLDQLFRNEKNMLKLGEEVRLARMTARVVSLTADGRPARVAFRFDVPLEDPSLRWLHFHEGQFEPWQPPAVGQESVLRPDWPTFDNLLTRGP